MTYNPVKDGILKTAKFVSYVEAKPPEPLQSFVQCYWELKTEQELAEDFSYHVLPDACLNILFNQVDTQIAAVTSLQTNAINLNLGKSFHYVGIQLIPGVWQSGPEGTISGLVNQAYEGALPLVEVNRKLVGLSFLEQQVVLNQLVEMLINDGVIRANPVVAQILSKIETIQSVADMASVAELSSRQLQRVLKQTIGLAPHDFFKVLRFQQTFQHDYLDHYVDQSHFIHAFRKITGYTPTKYTKKFDV